MIILSHMKDFQLSLECQLDSRHYNILDFSKPYSRMKASKKYLYKYPKILLMKRILCSSLLCKSVFLVYLINCKKRAKDPYSRTLSSRSVVVAHTALVSPMVRHCPMAGVASSGLMRSCLC